MKHFLDSSTVLNTSAQGPAVSPNSMMQWILGPENFPLQKVHPCPFQKRSFGWLDVNYISLGSQPMCPCLEVQPQLLPTKPLEAHRTCCNSRIVWLQHPSPSLPPFFPLNNNDNEVKITNTYWVTMSGSVLSTSDPLPQNPQANFLKT